MNTETNPAFNYQVGGSLSIDAPSYVPRRADDELYDALKDREFCYVLNSRQMGKSSLRVQMMHRLQQEGFVCADIDISVIGCQAGTPPDEWYGGFVDLLCREFQLSIDLETWWRSYQYLTPVQRLSSFIEEVLLAQLSQNIVIFIDEIDSLLTLDFKDDFFAFIRACYNKRSNNSKYRRLIFALLGVATPSDLIQDKKRTPFNIGKAIELHGFSLSEVMPLAPGLLGKVKNITATLTEVLTSTGGQPFLTQKLCSLIATSSSPISQGSEARSIDNLVRSLVENWEAQDVPQHLRTIRDRILGSRSRTIRLLCLYQQILQQGEITVDESPEQIELRLSGLVVKQGNSLKVYNHIYEKVFNQTWVKRELQIVRPYTESLNAWLDDDRRNTWLLQGQKLQEVLEWAADKSLGDQDYQFLRASQELDRKKTQDEKEKALQSASHEGIRANRWKLAASATVAVALTTILWGGFIFWQKYTSGQKYISWQKYTSCPFGQIKLNDQCLLTFSSGESIFFRSEGNFALESGVKYFKSGKYDEAIEFFKKAIESAPNNPEPQIYLNNAKVRQKGKPFNTLAVVVPIEGNAGDAKEVLRGVADAQTNFNFNKDKSLDGPLLEIMIADDQDNQNIAKTVAQLLAANSAVLGVIGHTSSETTSPALPEYEKFGLAMVSPASTSSSFTNSSQLQKSKVFFRTVSSTMVAGETLADYAKNTLALNKVVIFSDSDSVYSRNAKGDFEKAFKARGGEVLPSVNIRDSNLNVQAEIERLVNQYQVRAAVLLPGTQTISVAISVARANSKLPQQKRLQYILGGTALYSLNTLLQGGSAVEGLILNVPWVDDRKSSYAKTAQDRWQGKISWRTANGYDATQALIDALAKGTNPTRQTVLNNLRFVDLRPDQTSGDRLRFFATGDPDRKYSLVKVCKGKLSPQGSKSDFWPINECNGAIADKGGRGEIPGDRNTSPITP